MAARQQQDIAALREQTNAELKASAEETRRQIDAVNTLLRDAIQKRAADVFMTQQEVAKMNAERVNQLAEAIAQKISPTIRCPRLRKRPNASRMNRSTRSPIAWPSASSPFWLTWQRIST